MWNTIKEFWIRYKIYSLENKLRLHGKVRRKLNTRGLKITAKYEKYRARLVK